MPLRNFHKINELLNETLGNPKTMPRYKLTYDVLQHVQENYHDVLEPEQIIEISDVIVRKFDYTQLVDTIDDYVDIYRTDLLKQSK